jgi:hypothetical protein
VVSTVFDIYLPVATEPSKSISMLTLLWLPEGVIIEAGLAREETALKQIEKRVHFKCFAMAMAPLACFFTPFYPNTEFGYLYYHFSTIHVHHS